MRYKIFVFLVAVLVILSASVIWVGKSTAVMGRAQTVLTDEINKSLNGGISFSRLELDSFYSASLYDLVVHDGSGKVVVTAAQATGRFSLWSAFTGDVALEALKEVELLEPQLYLVRQQDGRWNLEDLLKDQNEQQEMPLSVVAKWTGGKVNLIIEGAEYQATDISGSANFLHKSRVEFSLTANYQGESITAEGMVKDQQSFFARVKTARFDVEAIRGLLPTSGTVVVNSGRLEDVTLTLRQHEGTLSYAGEADVRQASLEMNGMAIREGKGTLVLTHQKLFLYQAKGTVQDQPVTLQGHIALNTVEPVLDLTLQSPGLELSAIDQTLPLTGKAAFEARITGLASNPAIDGQFHIDQGVIDGIALANMKGKLYLADNLLTLSEVTANSLGGTVIASGQLDLQSRSYQARLRGTNLDCQAALNIPLGGARADVDIAASGQGAALPAISGTIVLAGAEYQGVKAEQISAGFFWSANQAIIDYLNITAAGGTITAKGTVIGDKLDLTVLGQAISLEHFSQLAQLPLAGQVDMEGVVKGSLERPVVSAAFAARDGQVLQQPFSIATGRLEITPDQLSLEQIIAQKGATTHHIQGTMGLTGEKQLNIAVHTKAARAETIIDLLMAGEQLTGNIDNELIISGPLASWNMTGKVKLWDGSFRGQLVSRIEGQYRRYHGITTFENFVIQSLGAEIRMSGSISASNELDIDLTAKDIELAKFHFSDSYPMSGQATFNGHLGGPVTAPSFDGRLTADKIRLNGQDITGINGTVRTVGSRIHVDKFGFNQGGGAFAFTGGLDQADETIYGTVTVDNGQLSNLLIILNSPVKEIEGRLNGDIEIGGTVQKPDIAVKGKLKAGKIKNYPLDSIEMDVDLTNGVIHVNNFFAKQGEGILVARGSADLTGDSKLEIGGRDIDAGLLTAWLDSNIETKGKLTFSAEINGKTRDPQVALSLQITNGQVANAGFDELYGLFTLNKGSIHVNQVMLLKGIYKASAYGTIPVAALSKAGRAKGTIADQMDLTVTLDKANLSILPLLTKEVSWGTGETKGQIKIGGTLYQPTVNGQFLVQAGVVKLKSLAHPIQKVEVDIQFEGDTMNIKSFSGHMGGGSYNLIGSTSWKGLAVCDYNLALTLDRLGVDHRYFKGPLQGNLRLVAKEGKPLLSGMVLLENDTINIPLLPEFDESNLQLALDLEIVAGKKVRLYNSYLYDAIVEGQVKFGGTTLEPIASGRFSAVRGTVSYLRTSFKLKDAVADFTQYRSFVPVIHLNASTRLEQTNVNLAIHGPLQAMEMTLSSEPAMSQQELLSLLTLRSRYSDRGKGDTHDSGLGRDEVLGLLDAGLQMRFLAEMEGAFRKAFGFDEFRLVRGTLAADEKKEVTDREVYNVEIGKYITDRLMLSYTLGIDHNEQSMAFRYDLSRRFSLTGSWDNERRSRFGLETRFTF